MYVPILIHNFFFFVFDDFIVANRPNGMNIQGGGTYPHGPAIRHIIMMIYYFCGLFYAILFLNVENVLGEVRLGILFYFKSILSAFKIVSPI